MTKANKYTVSYAQNREDIIIDAFFPDIQKGLYIDVGANHPLYHSVTKLFYDKGWTGINFEPNPKLFAEMKKHRPNDQNLMKGVGDKESIISLRVYHSQDGLEGISTLSSEMKEDYSQYEDSNTNDYSDLDIQVTTLKNFLRDKPLDVIHFMKVDVEGYEFEVLNGNDWTKYRPELICIEANHIVKNWRPILEKAEYELVFNDGLNDYYLSNEARHRKDYFDYAKVFLSSKPVITFEIAEKVRILEETQKHLISLEKSYSQKQAELDNLQNFVNEITPLKKHIKRQVRMHTVQRKKTGGGHN